VIDLIPQLADAIEAYMPAEEIAKFARLYGEEVKLRHPGYWAPGTVMPVDYHDLAQRLLTAPERGNRHRLLIALARALEQQCISFIGKTEYERRRGHEARQPYLRELREKAEAFDIAPSELSVEAKKPFTAKSELRDLIATATTDVFLVDAYLGALTLDALASATTPIRILTADSANAIDPSFGRARPEFVGEGRSLEVRTSAGLHDRFLYFNDRVWIVGSSIKDAGKKTLSVVEVVATRDNLVAWYEAKWTAGTVV
jgi:hypothetical protein